VGGGDATGGSGELARLIDGYGEYLVSDFQHYYHLDLTDVLRPGSGLSPRRALVLIRQLPIESATVAAMRGGPEFRGWGQDRYLMATLIDAVNNLNYTLTVVNTDSKKPKPQPPEPVYRPDKAAEKKKQVNPFTAIAKQKLDEARRRKAGRNGEGSRD
jgi:hypothetical protein